VSRQGYVWIDKSDTRPNNTVRQLYREIYGNASISCVKPKKNSKKILVN
jgi:hypothetical protein